MRSLLGANDNPNVQEFKASIRKLLFFNEITSSVFANCEDNLNILTVSSNSSSAPSNEPTLNDVERSEGGIRELTEIENQLDETEDIFERPETASKPETKEDITIGYVAAKIERKVETAKFACADCQHIYKEIFTINVKIEGVFLSHSRTPCESTYIICKLTHEILKSKIKPQILFDYKQIYALISEALCEKDFFVESDFSHDSSHKGYLLAYITDEYVRFYCTHVAKCATLDQQQMLIRNINRKVTHFKGQ